MENISRVKALLTRFNNKCDLENKPLFEVLCTNNKDWLSLLSSIGLDVTLLNTVSKSALESIIRTPDARFSFNASMQDLISDEIGIFSKSLNMYFGFNESEIKVYYDNTSEDQEFVYESTENMLAKKDNDGITTIHFSSDTVATVANVKKRVMTHKYPLEKAVIKFLFTKNGETTKKSITLKDGFLQKDLENIFYLFYRYNYDLAYKLLYFSTAGFKIVDDEVELNNFNNR